MGDGEFKRAGSCSAGSCVEVNVSGFRSADRCGTSTCVEVDVTGPQSVLVRDSKQNGEDPQPILSFTPGEWRAFVDGVKAGQFDLPGEVSHG